MRGAVVLGVLCTALSCAASAAAGDSAVFSMRGSHGYYVGVSARLGPEHRSVEVVAVRPTPDGLKAASYELASPRMATPRRIVASFGALGRVDVRYTPRRKLAGCSKNTGTFRGTVRFRGEGGYTSVHARKVRGTLSPFECVGPLAAPARRGDQLSPLLDACRPSRKLGYTAFSYESEVAVHQALLFERTKRLRITRIGQYTGPITTFEFGPDLQSATVRPRAPFTGSAIYSSGTLTGDLAVTMPGIPDPVPIVPAKAGLRERGSLTPGCERVFQSGTGALRLGMP